MSARRSRRTVLGGFVGVLALLPGCAAGPDAPGDADRVPRPEWGVGDRWVFRRTTLAGVTSIVTHQVVAVSAEGFTMRLLGLPEAVTRAWTTELHLSGERAGSARAARFEPPAQYFAWPLRLGQVWTQEFQYEDGAHDGRYTNTWQVGATVEPVDVVAGRFYTVRIERRGGHGEPLETYWYTPRVRYWARFVSHQHGYTEELVEFGRWQ